MHASISVTGYPRSGKLPAPSRRRSPALSPAVRGHGDAAPTRRIALSRSARLGSSPILKSDYRRRSSTPCMQIRGCLRACVCVYTIAVGCPSFTLCQELNTDGRFERSMVEHRSHLPSSRAKRGTCFLDALRARPMVTRRWHAAPDLVGPAQGPCGPGRLVAVPRVRPLRCHPSHVRASFRKGSIASCGMHPPGNFESPRPRHFHHLGHVSFQFTAQSLSSSMNAWTRDPTMGPATSELHLAKVSNLKVQRLMLVSDTRADFPGPAA
jgi:hypothetical protein